MSQTTTHCESCGTKNPETKDGYTTCCNEPTCEGGEQTWESCEGKKTIEIKACCGHHAGLKFSAMNIRRYSKAI